MTTSAKGRRGHFKDMCAFNEWSNTTWFEVMKTSIVVMPYKSNFYPYFVSFPKTFCNFYNVGLLKMLSY